MPFSYLNAVPIGNNLVGVLMFLGLIIFRIFFEKRGVIVASVLFLEGSLIALAAFGSYFAISIKRFYRYYMSHFEIAELQYNDEDVVAIFKDVNLFSNFFFFLSIILHRYRDGDDF